MLRVLLDVNVLGLGSNAPVTRAGIFRATEALSRALLRRDDLAVHFAAEATWASELLLLAYDRERGGLVAVDRAKSGTAGRFPQR